MHCRNNRGTNRALMVGNRGAILRLVPSNVLHRGMADVVNGNIILSPTTLVGRVGRLRSHNVPIHRHLLLSRTYPLVLSCRITLSGTHRGTHNTGTVNAANHNVKPTCRSGMTHHNLHINSLFSGRAFTRGLGRIVRCRGFRLIGCCGTRTISCRGILSSAVTITSVLASVIISISSLLSRTHRHNSFIVFRNTRNALLSVSRNACPCMASSGAATNNITANSNLNPHCISCILNVLGTCSAHMNTNPFPARLFSRANRFLYGRNGRFNTAAKHHHHAN